MVVDPQILTDWLGKPPAEIGGVPGEGVMQKWTALAALPQSEVFSGFIPENSPVVPNTGFSGVALRMNSRGK